MARTYRGGIIGRTGKGNYGHGLDVVWKGVKACQVVAVADDNKSALPAAMTRTGARKAYVDYREMLEKEKPDIVSISQRWLDRHHELLMAAGGSHALEWESEETEHGKPARSWLRTKANSIEGGTSEAAQARPARRARRGGGAS